MWMERRIAAAHFIQKMMRGCFARKHTNKLRQQREELKRQQIEQEREFRRKEEEKHEREIRRRITPRVEPTNNSDMLDQGRL